MVQDLTMRPPGARPARAWAGLVTAMAIVATTGALVTPAGAVGSPMPVCATAATSEERAVAEAARCGHAVTVGTRQNEFAQVSALPDGRLRYEAAVVPQRARQADGSWAEIDLTLVQDPTGRWRPRVSVADVSFSRGGHGPFIAFAEADSSMTFSWPQRLPEPVVIGDTITYREVLPGVDLVGRATRTGFTHVLVVRTRAAALSDAIRHVRMRIGGDAEIRQLPDGSMQATAGVRMLAAAEPAIMWDSGTTTTAARGAGAFVEAPPAPARSTASAAGDEAVVKGVQAEVTGGGRELLLSPDAGLLATGRLPLYIDPAWSKKQNKWAYATNNGSSNTDYTHARMGLNPDTGALFRSFFQFPVSTLYGKHIHSAYVQANLYHSYSCTDTNAYLWHTKAITSTMKTSWTGSSLIKRVATKAGHANKAGGCGTIQPDMIMNFADSKVTSLVQTHATDNLSPITVSLNAASNTAGDGEDYQSRWKRFYPESVKLIVDYDSIPGTPNSLQLDGVPCQSGVTAIGTLDPNLSAVLPDADSQTITGTFEWVQVPTSGNPDDATTRATLTKTATNNTRATTSDLTIVQGLIYAFRVKGTDPSPYLKSSSWSPWCTFRADQSLPPVTAMILEEPAGPGLPGRFRVESSATNVTKFKYGWGGPVTEVPASGTSPKYAEFVAIAPKYGRNILHVSAVNSVLAENTITREFTVAGPRPAKARWGLETYPGLSQSAALADAAGTSPLTFNGGWDSDTRLVNGQTASFNGSNQAATTIGPVVDTTGSFSVAAWVRLDALPTSDVKVLVQEGASAAGFDLGVRRLGSPLTPYWTFLMKDTSVQTSTSIIAASPTAVTSAEFGRWHHLAGVYDQPAMKIRLYVDGVLVAETARTAPPWQANGRFVVGRGFGYGAAENWWPGQIVDVHAYDRVLVGHDFTGQLASDPFSGGLNEPGMFSPVGVGDWDFEAATSCYLDDLADACETPDTSAWDRWLAFSRGTAVGAGPDGGSAVWFDNEYFPGEGFDPETTTEFGRSAVKIGVTPEDPDGLQYTLWSNRAVLRTDQSYTVSAWAKMDRIDAYQAIVTQDGTTNGAFLLYYAPENGGSWKVKLRATASATSDTDTTYLTIPAPSADANWTHLVVVVNVAERRLRLYVSGTLAGSVSMKTAWQPWHATGPLAIGRRIESGSYGSWLYGAVDSVQVWQGVMTDAAILDLHLDQGGDLPA